MNKRMLDSFVRLLITATVPLVLNQVAIEGKDIFSLDWRSLITGVVISLLIVAYNYYNPKDPRYGRVEKNDTEEGHT